MAFGQTDGFGQFLDRAELASGRCQIKRPIIGFPVKCRDEEPISLFQGQCQIKRAVIGSPVKMHG
ncbi:hypothetical protein [Hyphobacterium sp.]|uniref:hypothetical protein n=1 Tax=Hyphobacterium sp. TaxID=2004662 RepID=UPI003748BD8A